MQPLDVRGFEFRLYRVHPSFEAPDTFPDLLDSRVQRRQIPARMSKYS